MGPGGMRAEIARAQDAIEAVTGQRPRFFRAPAGLRSPFLEPVLAPSGCGSRVGRDEDSIRSTRTLRLYTDD